MGKKEPDWTDAEFEEVTPAWPLEKRRWWEGWYIDWRVFAVVAATSIAGLIAALKEPLQ